MLLIKNRAAGRLFLFVGGRIQFIIIGVPQIRRIRKQTTANTTKHVDTRLVTPAAPFSRVLDVHLAGALDFRGLCVVRHSIRAKSATSSLALRIANEQKC